MSTDVVEEVLADFGLSDLEIQVYVSLGKMGITRCAELTRYLKMHKAQVYRILWQLQAKGIVESTYEHPTRFVVKPFSTILDQLIKNHEDDARHLLEKRNELLREWRSIDETESPKFVEKLVVISGGRNVGLRISQMVKESANEILAFMTEHGLLRTIQMGIDSEAFEKAKREPDLSISLLVQVSIQNVKMMKQYMDLLSHSHVKNFEIRYTDMNENINQGMMLTDREEAIILLNPHPEVDETSPSQDKCMWTNSWAIVSTLREFYKRLWRDAKTSMNFALVK